MPLVSDPTPLTSSTVQTILDAVHDELGLNRPQGYVGSTDVQSRQMVALFHAVGDRLTTDYPWQALIKQHTYTGVPGTIQTWRSLPADFNGFVDETLWNTSSRVPVESREIDDYAAVEASAVTATPYPAQMLKANEIVMQPADGNSNSFSFYYTSSYWVCIGTTQASFAYTDRATADSDRTVYADDRLLISGVKYQWLRAKRLSYDEEFAEYKSRLRSNMGSDQARSALSLIPGRGSNIKAGIVVPVGNWSP